MQDNISNESKQPTQQPQDWRAEIDNYSPYWGIPRTGDSLQDCRMRHYAMIRFIDKQVNTEIRVDQGLITPAEALRYMKEVAWKEVCAEMGLPEPKTG